MWSNGQTILAIGPPTHMMGGMARVAEQVLRLDGLAGHRVVPFDFTFSECPDETLPARAARHWRQFRRLRATIGRLAPAIVHIHTCSGFSFYRLAVDMLVARRAGCSVILHVHGASFDEFFHGAGLPARRAIRWSLQKTDRVIALSPGWKRKIEFMAPQSRVTVIENAVEIPTAVSRAGADAGPCRFVFLARMDVWKGVDDLLAACEHLRDESLAFRLQLAGPPGSAGDQRTLAEKIHSRRLDELVSYVGPVEGDAKAELLQGSHAYIQPSHHEGMPIAVLEAMAHGLPIVATRVGAVPEMFKEGREGVLAPARCPAQLAGAMRRLIVDPACRGKMGTAARALAVGRYGLQRFHDDLIALYADMASERSGMPSRTRTADVQSALHVGRPYA